jgi:hypothetical protein
MRLPGNDAKELFNRYMALNESSVANMGVGTPTVVVVPAPGDNASGGSGVLKGRAPGSISTVSGPGDENEEGTCDSEQIEMAMTQLLSTADSALQLIDIIKAGGTLEPWAAAKITLGSDYIETVARYMKYGSSESDNEITTVPIEIESDIMVGEALHPLKVAQIKAELADERYDVDDKTKNIKIYRPFTGPIVVSDRNQAKAILSEFKKKGLKARWVYTDESPTS